MAMLRITFAEATFSRDDPRDRFDLTLGVEAALTLAVGDRLIYSEQMFPIVELRQALVDWMGAAKTDFEFNSMESDEPGLIWFRRQPSGLWRAGSIHQDDIAAREIDITEVVSGCADYVASVDAWVRTHLGVEVAAVLDG